MQALDFLQSLSGTYLLQILFFLMILCAFGLLNSDLILVVMGMFTGVEKVSTLSIIIVGFSGLLLGDSLLFIFGQKIGFKLLKFWPFYKIFKKSRIYDSIKFIRSRGPVVILMIRFIPGTRVITIFSSGIFKMKFYKFFIMNALGLMVMIPILVFSGKYLISSIGQAKDSLMYTSLVLILIFILLFFMRRKKFILDFKGD